MPEKEEDELSKALSSPHPSNDPSPTHSSIHNFVNSHKFCMCKFLVIVASVIFAILAEKKTISDESFVIVESVFMILFTIEFLLMVLAMRCRYFTISWNRFDFGLLLVGWACVAANVYILTKPEETTTTTTASVTTAMVCPTTTTTAIVANNLIQIGRVMRYAGALRFTALTQNLRLLGSLLTGNIPSVDHMDRVQRLCILLTFIRAHITAQQQLIRFVGKHGRPDSATLARCIIQSQTGVYEAMIALAYQEMGAGEWILDEKAACEDNIKSLGKLEAFVGEAQTGGVVSTNEAASFKHTMHHYVQKLMSRIDSLCDGSVAIDPLTPNTVELDIRCWGSLFEENDSVQTPQGQQPDPHVLGASRSIARE